MKDAIVDFIINTILDMMQEMTKMEWVKSDLQSALDLIDNAAGSPFFRTMKGVGATLLICMFFIHLLESALKDRADPDSLFKEMAMLGVYAIVILNLGEILSAVKGIAGGILDLSFDTYIIASRDTSDFLSGENSNPGALGGVLGINDGLNIMVLVLDALLYAVVGSLVMTVVQVICSIVVITIKMEIVIRTALMPLAVGFIAEDGWKGPGGRFIKKWCACLLQGVIIMLAFNAYAAVNVLSIGSGGSLFLVSLFAGGFALAGICTKSGQLANDVMGV